MAVSMSMQRRAALWFAAVALAPPTLAQQRRSLADPLRLGVDIALHQSSLAGALQRAFGRDTGIAVKLVPGSSASLLAALERGELDATLSNSPDAEKRLESTGLAHDRTAVASSEFVLVGPLLAPPQAKAPKAGKSTSQAKPRDPAGLLGAPGGAVAAMRRLAEAAAQTDSLRFISADDGSGTHMAEIALWRAAKIAPAPPWYQRVGGAGELIAQARRHGSYALVERGAWADHGGPPLAVLVQGDAALRVPVHFMRSFRSNHGAANLFSKWIAGPKGRAVIAAQRGYGAPGR